MENHHWCEAQPTAAPCIKKTSRSVQFHVIQLVGHGLDDPLVEGELVAGDDRATKATPALLPANRC